MLLHLNQGVGLLQMQTKIPKACWQLLRGLKHAAKCMGPITLVIQIEHAIRQLGSSFLFSLTKALSGMADLHNLRCFSFQAREELSEDTSWIAAGAFQEWVINRTSRIEALRLLQSKPRLALCAGKLQHLKHLEMEAHAFVWGVSQAGQLPSLETLHLHVDDHACEEINVLGYKHLTRLVVAGEQVQPILCEPRCQLGTHVHAFVSRYVPQQPWETVLATLDATTELQIGSGVGLLFGDCSQHSICQRCLNVETLTLDWPICHKHGERDLRKLHQNPAIEAKGLLNRCMPVNGQPLRSLKVLVMAAYYSMTCCIPMGMPNLEEMVLFVKGTAEVSFDNPVATMSALTTLYIFGQPLTVDMSDSDRHQVSDNMARRGLLLSTVKALEAGAEEDFRDGSSCMYLRPVTAREASIEELHDKTSQLVRQCRCNACLGCLRQAGRLPWC